MSSKKTKIEYLENILKSWPKISNNNSLLYGTYITSNTRCDIYDNSLLANCLISISDTPHPIAISILNFFLGTYQYFKENNIKNNLIQAAYLIDASGNYNTCYDVSCKVQDVGNNSMVCIALTKFCIKYPNNENTPKYLETLLYLVSSINSLKCTTKVPNQSNPNSPVIGYKGRTTESYVSTEHMIDLYALTNMMSNLFLPSGVKNMVNEMKQNSQTFVINMYQKNSSLYLIGCTPNCGGLNNSDVQPVDVLTWNMLSGVDNNKERKKASLTLAASPEFSIPFTKSEIGGIKFTNKSDCPQYENTGSFLCALLEYKYIFNEDIISPNSKDMFDFIQDQINQTKPFKATYGNSECPTGLGWSYYESFHLASTIYCLMANIAKEDPSINIYRYGCPFPSPPQHKNNIVLYIIIGTVLSIIAILLLFLILRKS